MSQSNITVSKKQSQAEIKRKKYALANLNAIFLHNIIYLSLEKGAIPDSEAVIVFAFFERMLVKLNNCKTYSEIKATRIAPGWDEFTDDEKPSLAVMRDRYVGKTKEHRLAILKLQSRKIADKQLICTNK